MTSSIPLPAGISYRWWETLFTRCHLRKRLTERIRQYGITCRTTSRSIWGRSVSLLLGIFGPMEARVVIINVLDRANVIRSGREFGVFAPSDTARGSGYSAA